MPVQQQPAAPQPNPEFVIAALQEELSTAQNNRLYLIAMIKQMQNEFQEQKTLWEMEKASLTEGRNEAASADEGQEG